MFTPVLAKHTKSFNLVDTLSVGVDRIQRNFEPMQRQVESWRRTQITDAEAKLIFYSAFVEGKLDAPKSLLPGIHRLYFEPQYPEFSPRTMWSLSNAFTSAFKKDGKAAKVTLHQGGADYVALVSNVSVEGGKERHRCSPTAISAFGEANFEETFSGGECSGK